CGVCHKSFAQSAQLARHVLAHAGERPHRCGACGRAYNHVSSLVRHRRCHRQPGDGQHGAGAANGVGALSG
ncbi:ZN865 protein, partial [Alopecoenas beccarii]|nr:ZN865 protein [Alopecoenas beccarii]